MSGVSRASLWAGSMRSSAAALSFLSYYRANEVQQFRYSRPFRKGEKDPENEFAVSSRGLFSLQLGWELGLHVSVRRPEVSLGGHSSGASLLVIWTKGPSLGLQLTSLAWLVAREPLGISLHLSSPALGLQACATTPGFVHSAGDQSRVFWLAQPERSRQPFRLPVRRSVFPLLSVHSGLELPL